MKAQLLMIVLGWAIAVSAQEVLPVGGAVPTWIVQLAGGSLATIVCYRFLFYELPAWRKQSADAIEMVREEAEASRAHVERVVTDFAAMLQAEREFHQKTSSDLASAIERALSR